MGKSDIFFLISDVTKNISHNILDYHPGYFHIVYNRNSVDFYEFLLVFRLKRLNKHRWNPEVFMNIEEKRVFVRIFFLGLIVLKKNVG